MLFAGVDEDKIVVSSEQSPEIIIRVSDISGYKLQENFILMLSWSKIRKTFSVLGYFYVS